METIGELAHRTHTSARMLRHWEAEGLLEPAAVDPWTRSRLYAPAQSGRVRAIFALRESGFGLDAIRELLAQGLTEARLRELLSQREAELAAGIARDTAALARVRERLRAIDEDEGSIASSLELTALPALRLRGVREIVGDETEIPDAVHRLLSRLAPGVEDHDLVLGFDGTSDPAVIAVTAALAAPHTEAEAAADDGGTPRAEADGDDLASAETPEDGGGEGTELDFPGAERAAVARLSVPPTNTADAWVVLDAALAERDLRALGPYRKVLHADGAVTLATPVESSATPAAEAD